MSNNFEKNKKTLISCGVCPMLAQEICEKIAEHPDEEEFEFLFTIAQILFLGEVAGDVETV